MTTEARRWELTLEYVADRLNRAEVPWMLVGSAATAVHGADLAPGDIDILMPTASDVRAAAAVLPGRTERWSDPDPGTWLSSGPEPVLSWIDHGETTWTFGRWMIKDTKVELAHLEPAVPSRKLIETGAAQSVAIRLDWHQRSLPVVPIELQLGTMIARDQQDRLTAALAANNVRDLDASMLLQTLSDRQLSASDPRIPRPLRGLLQNRR